MRYKILLSCILLLTSLLLDGCNGCSTPLLKCDLSNPRASARVVITTITAPPGGGAHRFLEVSASGFHPNAQAQISIPSYPTVNGTESLQETVTFDAQGALNWRKEPVTLLGPNSDPNVDISITVKEVNSGCFAITIIKQSEFMKIL